MDANINAVRVDDFITFEEEKLKYQVMARGERYIVCTKPFNARRTVLYTVIDLDEQIRGTENLIFGLGAETRKHCEDMLARLEGRDADRECPTKVSHRNRVPLRVEKVWISATV